MRSDYCPIANEPCQCMCVANGDGECRLRKKALAEPEQSDPVAWRPKLEHPIPYTTGRPQPQDITHWVVNSGCEIEYAYTAPPRREPLSDEQVGMLTVFPGLHHVETPLLAAFIRHIEQAITGEKT